MAFQLIHEDEPLPIKNLVVVIFGEWGVGKSSLGFTANEPLMLDYDKGLERAVGRKLSVKLSTWEDSQQFMDSGILIDKKIQTLIIDTAGTMLDDYLAHHLIKMDAKNGNGSGGLGLRGYGSMKDEADKFISKAQSMNIDLIFICHTAEDGDGDNKKLKPKMTGGSYGILMAKADLIGYLEMKSGKITLDFNPTDRHTGKNCAQIPLLNVPHFESQEYIGFMDKIIVQTKNHMAKANAAQIAAVKLVDEFKAKINEIKSMDELEDLMASIQILSPMYKAQVNQSYERKFLEFWQPVFMNPEKLKTGPDFDALAEIIKDLPPGVQMELRAEFKKLLTDAGLVYQKNKDPKLPGRYMKPGDIPQETKPVNDPASKQAQPPGPAHQPEPAKVFHDEDWFTSKVGKKILAKSKAFNGPMQVNDLAHAGHLCHVSQKSSGYEFFEIPEESKQPEPTQPETVAEPAKETVQMP